MVLHKAFLLVGVHGLRGGSRLCVKKRFVL